MSTPFSQSQLAQPIATVPSNAGSWTSATGHLLPLSAMFKTQGHRSRSHSHSSGHSRSRSNSLVPSPAPSLGYIPSPSPAPMEQGHHYRPRTHSHSSDYHHHHHQPHSSHGHSRSHSHGRSHNPAPPLQPIAPYMTAPAASYTASGYQPQYATQPGSGYTLAPLARSVPMPPVPAKVPRGIPAPPRAAHVSQMSGSRARKPLVSQEVDAPERPRQDWRCHPLFRHSRCTGRRKALCVGINYTGQQNALHGCVNDARDIYQFLMEHHRYPYNNIIVLTDDSPHPKSQPTRKNMLNAMRWLVEDARPDDALFFHYSGHGGRTRDLNGDEVDGWDEVIFPVDYKTAGIITDDLLHDSLVRPLPAGCRLTGVFDSCHSASILDLTFEFHSNGKARSISPVAPAYQQEKTTPADVISFSGCKDSQTSADVVQGGVAVGAMSYAFLKVLKRNPQITYIDLLRGVREILNKKYSQRPQLSASHKIDINLQFIM